MVVEVRMVATLGTRVMLRDMKGTFQALAMLYFLF